LSFLIFQMAEKSSRKELSWRPWRRNQSMTYGYSFSYFKFIEGLKHQVKEPQESSKQIITPKYLYGEPLMQDLVRGNNK